MGRRVLLQGSEGLIARNGAGIGQTAAGNSDLQYIMPKRTLGKKDKKKQTPFRQTIRNLLRRRPRRRSLRFYVFLVTLLIGCLPCLVLRWSILSNYETRVVNSRTSEAQTQLMVLANHLLSYNYLEDPTSEIVEAELTQFGSFYDGRVLVIDDSLTVVKDTYEMSTGKIVVSDDVVRCLTEGSSAITTRYVREDGYIEVIMPISQTRSLESGDYSGQSQEGETVYGVLLASVSTDSIAATLQVLRRRANLILLVAVLVVFSAAVLASTWIARPFEKLTKAFQDVQSGYTTESVQVGDFRETQEIVEAFNQVVSRMRSLDESRQEFVSNVSHELRTPMTSMKVLADSLLQMGDNVPPEMYREFLQDIAQELDRENRTIDDLLNLSRMDRRQVTLNLTTVNVNDLVEQILKQIRPLAQEKDVELILVSERRVQADIDEVKMSMAFTNLIENAVKYNVEHGRVTVTVDADRKNMIFICEDTGIGIPGESQERIFERFYRVDPSRSHEISGTGLGLAIAKSVVLLHRGTITVESHEHSGSTFTVTVPLTRGAEPKEEKPKELIRAEKQARRQEQREHRRVLRLAKKAEKARKMSQETQEEDQGPTPQI